MLLFGNKHYTRVTVLDEDDASEEKYELSSNLAQRIRAGVLT
jgi:hypothetical protein